MCNSNAAVVHTCAAVKWLALPKKKKDGRDKKETEEKRYMTKREKKIGENKEEREILFPGHRTQGIIIAHENCLIVPCRAVPSVVALCCFCCLYMSDVVSPTQEHGNAASDRRCHGRRESIRPFIHNRTGREKRKMERSSAKPIKPCRPVPSHISSCSYPSDRCPTIVHPSTPKYKNSFLQRQSQSARLAYRSP